jgi:hypothetical protein
LPLDANNELRRLGPHGAADAGTKKQMDRFIIYQLLKHFALAVQGMYSAAALMLYTLFSQKLNERAAGLMIRTMLLFVNEIICIPISNRVLATGVPVGSQACVAARFHSKKYL